MWTLYLWEHYGGNEMTRALVAEGADGIEGVNNALAARGQADDFEAAFRKWVVANYLDDGTGDYGYDGIELLASGPYDYSTSFPRPVLAATHSGYPLVAAPGDVNYWAADAIKLVGLGGQDLNLAFNGANDNRFAATVVRSSSANLHPGSNTVSQITLNSYWHGSTVVAGAGTQAVLLIPASLSESGARGYTYSASLGSAPVYDQLLFLPLVMRPPTGIKGLVTYGGGPASGLKLDLMRREGGADYGQATLTTAADGSYYFTSVPPLAAGQSYYVSYLNDPSSANPGPGYLYNWAANLIGTYSGVSDVAGGNFDVSDVPLVAPGNGAALKLPITFQWTRRGIASDSYELMLVNLSKMQYTWTGPLGYVSGVTIIGLPSTWDSGDYYVWWVNVYKSGSPRLNMGSSYGERTLTIYTSVSAQESQGMELEALPPQEDVRPEWRARVESLQP